MKMGFCDTKCKGLNSSPASYEQWDPLVFDL